MPRTDMFDRDVLEVLQFELDFVEQGGYGRSVRTPRVPRQIFLDSPACLNFGEPERPLPCSRCVLIDFVPEERRSEAIPCHHIPLNSSGATVESLFDPTNEAAAQEALRDWLQNTIARLKQEEAREGVAVPEQQWAAET